MNEQERRDYAAHLVIEHARDVEFLSVHEMYADYIGDYRDDRAVLSDEEASAVLDLVHQSDVTVSWPDTPEVA